jgi:hypothetical protein
MCIVSFLRRRGCPWQPASLRIIESPGDIFYKRSRRWCLFICAASGIFVVAGIVLSSGRWLELLAFYFAVMIMFFPYSLSPRKGCEITKKQGVPSESTGEDGR